MKNKLLYAALAATVGLMTSCSQDEDLSTHTTIDSYTIAFATRSAKPTRSAVSITSIHNFAVSAVNSDNSAYFSNEEFFFNNVTEAFQSIAPHYWPTTGTLSFYAISDMGTPSVDTNNVPQYSYSNWAAEKDLVAATVKAGVKQIPYPLTFQHVTSQIYVSAEAENKTEQLSYKLVSIKMTAPSTGTYSFATTTGGIGSWTIDNTKTSEYSYGEALPRTFNYNGQIELSSCYWNILPLTDGTIKFKIEYQVYQNGKIIADFTGNNCKECFVNNPGLLSSKMYRYNFILTRGTNDEVTFTSSMGNWTENGSADNQTVTTRAENTAVDLGLSDGTKWAKGNLGAENETDYGLYYSWGNTNGYSLNGTGTYSFTSSTYSTTPGSSLRASFTSGGSNDAATARLGASWKMPTKDQAKILSTECYWTYTSNYDGSGVIGYIVYRVKNENDKGIIYDGGKYYKTTDGTKLTECSAPTASYTLSDTHIFFPANGRFLDSSTNSEKGKTCYYWASSLQMSGYGNGMTFNRGLYNAQSWFKSCCGAGIRAVQ